MKQAWLYGCLIAVAAILAAGPVAATDYFVAPDGDDAGAGTLASPFRSPVLAAKKLLPGDTLYFRKGTYKCRTDGIIGLAPSRDGEEGKPITFRNHGNEHVVVDVAGSDWGFSNNGFSWIVIDGFEVTGGTVHYNMKISAHHGSAKKGTGDHVTIRNCEVHHSQGENIFVHSTPHLVVENCHLHDSANSHGLYLAVGCHNAVIRNVTSENNRGNSGTQLNGDAGPEGITNALVECNLLRGNAQGYSLMNLRDSVFRNNMLFNNGFDGPRGSGYREVILWNKRTEEGTGCRNVVFEHNTFVNLCPPGHAMGSIVQSQSSTRDITFRNNIFLIRRRHLFTFRDAAFKGFCFDNNCLFMTEPGAQVEQGGSLTAFSAGNGFRVVGSIEKDPLFADLVKGDLRLAEASPCIDAGIRAGSQQQIVGNAPDIGADEFGSDIRIGCRLPWK